MLSAVWPPKVTVSILAGAFTDLAGNSNAMTSTLKIDYDTNSPTVDILSSTTQQVAESPIPISVFFQNLSVILF
jgi:hypothetical protein